jgi:hypothetical protein
MISRTAIQREKIIKHYSRAWKVRLILATNPQWNDLFETLVWLRHARPRATAVRFGFSRQGA